jgi:hypothetical protein
MIARRWIAMMITGMLTLAAACSGSSPTGLQDDPSADPPTAPMDTTGFVPTPGS